jgi:hypothetical protein
VNTYKLETQVGLTVTNGTETDSNWNVGAEFKGLSVGIGGDTKEYSSEEVSKSTTKTFEVPCEPHKTTYFYVKRYKFQPKVWFDLYAWTQDWTVGHSGSHDPIVLPTEMYIDSDEYLTTTEAVVGHGPVSVNGMQGYRVMGSQQCPTRKFENITYAAQDYLSQHGISG